MREKNNRILELSSGLCLKLIWKDSSHRNGVADLNQQIRQKQH